MATGLITVMAWHWWGIGPIYLLQNNNRNLYYTEVPTSMMNCPQIVTRMYFYSQCQYGSVSVPVPALDQKSAPVQAWGPSYIHIVCQMVQPWLQMLTKVGQTMKGWKYLSLPKWWCWDWLCINIFNGTFDCNNSSSLSVIYKQVFHKRDQELKP